MQWPAAAIADYDHLVAVEDRLIASIRGGAAVDGHDIGSGEMNIFIETDHPVETFDDVRSCLAADAISDDMRAAYREVSGDEYTVLWPRDLHTFSVA